MSDSKADAKAIFLEALDRTRPAGLVSYLDRACGNDLALRARVTELLAAHEDAGNFLGRPDLEETTPREPLREGPGTLIGPYKLLEQIGEGGFGVVFMAEQIKPIRRNVALKILKPGMDTRQVIARFEAERQALALMDHPNIAHVMEGGETASGRPYFVMELVRGVAITDFADRNHLAVRERLELFRNVCRAVQHAHQKGIIHRDLKPSNVMVTLHDETPMVKVIDFGIAKATGHQLTDKTLFTNFAQMLGTPLYMSPEQAQMSGLNVDTRTDIYSLGVLLYELLTGTTPFDNERFGTAPCDEMRRIIREEEPARPSTRISSSGTAAAMVSANRRCEPKRLSQLVRGELDWITMKCLEKDRNRRYQTANTLAGDVERYLRDEPVLACPPSAWYRFVKLARRHKSLVVTASAVTAALALAVVALGVSALLLWRDNRRAQEALRQTRQVQQVEQEAREDVERNLYFQSIARVDLEWWNNNADGQRLPTVSHDGSAKVWQASTGQELATVRGHNGPLVCVAFSPFTLAKLGAGDLDGSRKVRAGMRDRSGKSDDADVVGLLVITVTVDRRREARGRHGRRLALD
jgi:serine/threonine protein kinase